MNPLDQSAIQATTNQANLADNRDPLWGLALVLLALLGWLMAETNRLQAEMSDLQAALQLERAKRFGRSSERNAKGPAPEESSLPLIIEGEADEIAVSPASPTSGSAPRQRGGQPGPKGHGRSLPPHLPRQEVVCDLPVEAQCCPTCGQPYVGRVPVECG